MSDFLLIIAGLALVSIPVVILIWIVAAIRKKPTKQLKYVVLALIAVFVLFESIGIAIGCDHKWIEASCTEAKTCELCGDISGEPMGHQWKDATCDIPKTCSVCGETQGEALGHDWVESTCLLPQTCVRCNATVGEALGHSWTDASCTAAKTCDRCGTTDGDPLGHDTSDQSCTADVNCIRCNKLFSAPGHSEKAATCTDAALCTVCGEVLGEALGHSWVDATCTTAMTCSVCNVSEGDALGHSWIDATCTSAKSCSVCAVTEGNALGHSWSDATCTAAKTCTVCAVADGDALGHNWTAATCIAAKYCSRCSLTEGTALGHSTTSGTCSRCGVEMYETVSGYGDDVVSDVTVGDGIYRVHFKHSGRSNFVVKSYDATGDYELLINEIGNYDGCVLLLGKAPYAFEITAGGSWEYTIEQLEVIDDTAFAGWGDYVTGLCSITSGAWVFTHDGSSNFVVRIYTSDGRNLLVNEIGYYSGKKMVTIPTDSYAFFEITADGNWTIKKA